MALCGALQLAHTAGVVHRDLKPANVVSHEYMPGHYVYKVVDFGLVNVREIAGALKLTLDRQFLGTVAYASPEQLRGEVVDARSDIYSFCAMLYELLTGRPPFDHDDPFVVITKHLMREPQPLRDLMPSIPAALEAVVLQGLAKDPAQRPASMEALAKALRASVGPDPDKTWITTSAPVVDVRERPAPVVRGYELGAPVSKGRLGSQIYLGTHKALGTSVAIRVLRREDVADWDAARERFIREARAMQVNHPNVIHVKDFGEEPDYVYVVTDFILGESLLQRLANDGPLTWPVLERLTSQLIDGVAALHRRGAFVCGITPLTTRLTRGGRRGAAPGVVWRRQPGAGPARHGERGRAPRHGAAGVGAAVRRARGADGRGADGVGRPVHDRRARVHDGDGVAAVPRAVAAAVARRDAARAPRGAVGHSRGHPAVLQRRHHEDAVAGARRAPRRTPAPSPSCCNRPVARRGRARVRGCIVARIHPRHR